MQRALRYIEQLHINTRPLGMLSQKIGTLLVGSGRNTYQKTIVVEDDVSAVKSRSIWHPDYFKIICKMFCHRLLLPVSARMAKVRNHGHVIQNHCRILYEAAVWETFQRREGDYLGAMCPKCCEIHLLRTSGSLVVWYPSTQIAGNSLSITWRDFSGQSPPSCSVKRSRHEPPSA